MIDGGGSDSKTSKVRIMGIVNVTPDSFWKGSRGLGHQGAELALQLLLLSHVSSLAHLAPE